MIYITVISITGTNNIAIPSEKTLNVFSLGIAIVLVPIILITVI